MTVAAQNLKVAAWLWPYLFDDSSRNHGGFRRHDAARLDAVVRRGVGVTAGDEIDEGFAAEVEQPERAAERLVGGIVMNRDAAQVAGLFCALLELARDTDNIANL